jgi:hypothetical protein
MLARMLRGGVRPRLHPPGKRRHLVVPQRVSGTRKPIASGIWPKATTRPLSIATATASACRFAPAPIPGVSRGGIDDSPSPARWPTSRNAAPHKTCGPMNCVFRPDATLAVRLSRVFNLMVGGRHSRPAASQKRLAREGLLRSSSWRSSSSC